jgi:nucleotide-binding universal stress UspA family protein
MTYKTILLHLHDVRRAQRLLAVALPLVAKMDAHLIALNVMPPYVVISGGEMGMATIIDAHREAYQVDVAQLKQHFAAATRLSAGKMEWRDADAGYGSATDTVVRQGAVCDLIIASQKDQSWTMSDFLEEPQRLAIETGRPVMLVPNEGKIVSPPKRVTIAWNGRREAVRAVFDAMPLLVGADEVNILWAHPENDQPAASDLPGAALATVLARHGIKCVVSQSSAADANIGGELLQQADAFGSDLLVMGCYGHSRMREFVLGGATRDVLSQMDLPVLMSH